MFDLPDYKLWVPPKPAIIRPATPELVVPDRTADLDLKLGYSYGMPIAVPGGSPSLMDAVNAAGLAAACKLCLDASVPASFPGSGQSWFDLSGNGNNFHLGDTSSAETNPDPVWTSNGAQSYFASNGANSSRFTFAGTMAGHFFNTLHYSSHNWCAIYFEDWNGTNYGSGWSTKPGSLSSSSGRGVAQFMSGGSYIVYTSSNAAGIQFTNPNGTLTPGTPGVHLMGMRDNGGNNRDYHRATNSAWSAMNANVSFTPTNSDVTGTFKLGGANDASSNLSTGRKVYGFLMFNRLVTQAEYDDFRDVLGPRFPTILT